MRSGTLGTRSISSENKQNFVTDEQLAILASFRLATDAPCATAHLTAKNAPAVPLVYCSSITLVFVYVSQNLLQVIFLV